MLASRGIDRRATWIDDEEGIRRGRPSIDGSSAPAIARTAPIVMWLFLRTAPLVLPGDRRVTARDRYVRRERDARGERAAGTDPAIRTGGVRRWVRVALSIAAVGVVLGLGLLAMREWVWGAPREVVAGRLYRSAQLSTDDLDRVIDRYGIQHVLSLRKFDPPAPDLKDEIAHLDARRLSHANIALSPSRLPKPEAMADLLHAFEVGPYPLILHCEEGVDRTGLATVVWLVVHGGQDLATARAHELSMRSGYFAFGQAHAMDDFFELYERSARGQDLATWILETYPSVYGGATTPHPPGEVLASDRGKS